MRRELQSLCAKGRRDDLECAPLRFAHKERNNYFIFAFVAACGPLQTHFHERGRDGERHLQRRFLRKHGAVVGVLALSVTAYAVPPLAKPYTLHFSRKLHRHAKGSPFGRAGA